MNAVSLVQLRISRHSFEKKRIQQNIMLLCKAGINRREGFGVFAAEIGRCQHARKQDRDAAFIEMGKDRGQVCQGRTGVQAPQGVVGAELNNYGIRCARRHAAERPVQPRESAGGGIAGHAGVDDGDVAMSRAKGLLQLGRERLVLGKPVSGGEAVADHEKPHGGLGRGGHRDAERHRQHRRPSGSNPGSHPGGRVDNREGVSISEKDLAAEGSLGKHVVAVKARW